MTLIIACKCSDGIVIASDSQETFGSSAGPIKRKVLDKIFPISGGILIGGAGHSLIMQRLKNGIDNLSPQFSEITLEDARDIICDNIMHPLRKEMLNKFKDIYGPERGEKEAPSVDIILTGYSLSGIPTVYMINRDGIWEEESDYCAIGIGDAFAHIMLKDIDTCSLEIEKIKPIIYKTILDAIETGAYGMGEPITLWTVIMDGNSDKKASLIEQKEIQGIKTTVETMKGIINEIIIGTDNEKQKK